MTEPDPEILKHVEESPEKIRAILLDYYEDVMTPEEDPATGVKDLMADIFHYCTKHGINIDAVLNSARHHHYCEQKGIL